MKDTQNGRDLMTRREAILRVSAMLGGAALVGQGAMLAGCVEEEAGGEPARSADPLFTETEVTLLDEIAETILPETATPGARAAGVGPFIAMMVTETYDDRDQRVFRDGMAALDEECRETHGASYLSATPGQRLALLEKLDGEQMHYMRTRADEAPAHYFRMMKELALLGYFTSEIGYRQAMRYVETPGRYEPCVPYEPGEKAWAPHA